MSAEFSPSSYEYAFPEDTRIVDAAEYLGMATENYFSFCEWYAQRPSEPLQNRLMKSCEIYGDAIIGYFRAIQTDEDLDPFAFTQECQELMIALDKQRVTKLNSVLGGEFLGSFGTVTGQVNSAEELKDRNKNNLSIPDFKQLLCVQFADEALELAASDTYVFIKNIVF